MPLPTPSAGPFGQDTPGRRDQGGVVGRGSIVDRMTGPDVVRLTQYAHGGGCACKIPPGELEETIAGLVPAGPGLPAGVAALLSCGRDW